MDLDFYTLERPVQDRFADATRSIGVPTPIVRELVRDRSFFYWFSSALLVTIGLVLALFRGFGRLNSTIAIAPVAFAAGYAAAAGVATYCLFRAAARRHARATIPYRPGLYLFPAGVFDARSEPIRVYLHPELRGASAEGAKLRVGAERVEFVFRLPDPGTAEQAKQELDQARERYEQALLSDNRREQAMLDPLIDSGFSSPFSPRLRLVKSEPMWAKLAAVFAVAIGAAAGPALWKIRNVASERRLYAIAIHRNDASGYRAYLARGGSRPEVTSILLPRAELRDAMRAHTVEALEEFASAHPGTRIATEVEAARQAEVRAEFEDATKVGTVTALREFAAKRAAYPFIQPSVQAAIVAIYRRLLAGFVPGKDPAVASFFERLLGYTKVHGPHATIEFVRKIPDSVSAADGQVKASAYFMGKESIPSQYFTGDYASRREAASAERLVQAIAPSFPPDVLKVEPGPTFTDPGPPPPPTEPTLVIEYSPQMAGGYMNPKPRGVFVGVGMTFKASFVIPGDAQPLEVHTSLWRVPNLQILQQQGTTIVDVYEHMAGDGFSRFEKDFFAFIGPKSGDAPK